MAVFTVEYKKTLQAKMHVTLVFLFYARVCGGAAETEPVARQHHKKTWSLFFTG